MKNVIKKDVQISPPAETQKLKTKVDTDNEIEEVHSDSSCEKILVETPLPISTGPKLTKSHTLKGGIRNPFVPAFHAVEPKPTDPDERALNFAARVHEFLRWAISSVIIFVPIKFIAEAQKKEPAGVALYTILQVLLQDFDLNIAYPFCAVLVVYGTFHVVAAYISDPVVARQLEYVSLLGGVVVLAAVFYYIGKQVFFASVITGIVANVVIQVYLCFRRCCGKEETVRSHDSLPC